MFKKIHIRSYEVGLKFRNGESVGLLAPGKRYVCTWFGNASVRIVSKRDPWLFDEQLDVIVKSGALAGKAEVIDLTVVSIACLAQACTRTGTTSGTSASKP
jgi:hypothetical protein